MDRDNNVIRNLVIGVGRIGGRALVRAAQSVAQDGIRLLGDAQTHVKKAHDALDGIVDAPSDPQPIRVPVKRV